ncbi:MAG: YraN family protein [Clostridia bacterium]|nr:YraN family protein [Clostridia bacterium]
MNKKEFGNIGETIACKYLLSKKYKIVERNFYYYGGEIDIIAYDESAEVLIFIEVKTRSNLRYGLASESIGYVKLKRIIKGAKYYMFLNGINGVKIRFDALELYYKNNKFLINHIKEII